MILLPALSSVDDILDTDLILVEHSTGEGFKMTGADLKAVMKAQAVDTVAANNMNSVSSNAVAVALTAKLNWNVNSFVQSSSFDTSNIPDGLYFVIANSLYNNYNCFNVGVFCKQSGSTTYVPIKDNNMYIEASGIYLNTTASTMSIKMLKVGY